MSSLVAIAYDDRAVAESVRQKLIALRHDHVIELEDAVVVTTGAGHVTLHPPPGTGYEGDAMSGSLLGLVFLAPLLGIAMGAATGVANDALADVGVDDGFLRQLGDNLDGGKTALLLLVHRDTPDKVLPRVSCHGGHVIQSPLKPPAERRLRQALAVLPT